MTAKHFLPLVLFCASCFGGPVTLHVAPSGSDANPGTVERPFATLARARDAIRAIKRAGPLPGPVEVLLAPGIYAVSEPTTFTPEDSGTAAAPIVYRGAEQLAWRAGPTAVISGAKPIK